jgi:hypothetical protein
MKKYWWRCPKEKSKKSHETVPLKIRCHTWKWAETGKFSGKMDLLSHLDEMSQQSWTKNTRTKCHRLWDKILQWDGLSHCDKPSKFTRSECHNFGWTDNPSTLRRIVTVVKCHSRRFVGWTKSVGLNVTWSVFEWTDRQCTLLAVFHCLLSTLSDLTFSLCGQSESVLHFPIRISCFLVIECVALSHLQWWQD